jgi:hypothetical protein
VQELEGTQLQPYPNLETNLASGANFAMPIISVQSDWSNLQYTLRQHLFQLVIYREFFCFQGCYWQPSAGQCYILF